MNGLRWELARPRRQELECAVLDRVGIPGTLRGARADRCSYFKGYSLNNVGRCASPSKILYSLCDLVGAVCATAEGSMTAILIVEDDVLANEHLEYILQQAGYEVLSATSADDAVELLEDSCRRSTDRHRYQSAGDNEWSETRRGGEGSATEVNYHHRDGL